MAEGRTAHDHAAELAAFLDRHPRALVLTGAGLSTASGIPDYRDRDGTRRGRAPIHGPDFRKYEQVQKRYWARSMIGWPVLSRARPNLGHMAIAALEKIGHIGAVLTQNVDGLHGQAGSHGVLELHGNIHSVVCLECSALFPRAFARSNGKWTDGPCRAPRRTCGSLWCAPDTASRRRCSSRRSARWTCSSTTGTSSSSTAANTTTASTTRQQTAAATATPASPAHDRFMWSQVRYEIDWCLAVVAARLRDGRPSGAPVDRISSRLTGR